MSQADCLVLVLDETAEPLPQLEAPCADRELPALVRRILVARAAQRVRTVVVATQRAEALRWAEEWGAEGVLETAADDSTLAARALRVLAGLAPSQELPYVALLPVSGPLRTPAQLDTALDSLARSEADGCFSAVAVQGSLWRLVEGRAEELSGRSLGEASPAAARVLREDGSLYVMRRDSLLRERRLDGGRLLPLELQGPSVAEPQHSAPRREPPPLSPEESRAAQRLRLPKPLGGVVFDFDGVMSDNTVLVDETGKEAVPCSRGDGMGIGLLQAAGVRLLILSKERNPVVSRRAEKLKLECLQGVDDKPTALRRWAEATGVTVGSLIYVGNDVNDVECMTLVGCSACPSDSHPSALAVATLQLTLPGGRGAVRELADLILEARERSR